MTPSIINKPIGQLLFVWTKPLKSLIIIYIYIYIYVCVCVCVCVIKNKKLGALAMALQRCMYWLI